MSLSLCFLSYQFSFLFATYYEGGKKQGIRTIFMVFILSNMVSSINILYSLHRPFIANRAVNDESTQLGRMTNTCGATGRVGTGGLIWIIKTKSTVTDLSTSSAYENSSATSAHEDEDFSRCLSLPLEG
jgi:hypothetical protein